MTVGILTGEENLKSVVMSALDSYDVREIYHFSFELLQDEGINTLIIYEDTVMDVSAATLAKEMRERGIRLIFLVKSERQDRIAELIDEGIYDILTGEFKKEEVPKLIEQPNGYQEVADLHKRCHKKKTFLKKQTEWLGNRFGQQHQQKPIVEDALEEEQIGEYAFESKESSEAKLICDTESESMVEGVDKLEQLLGHMQTGVFSKVIESHSLDEPSLADKEEIEEVVKEAIETTEESEIIHPENEEEIDEASIISKTLLNQLKVSFGEVDEVQAELKEALLPEVVSEGESVMEVEEPQAIKEEILEINLEEMRRHEQKRIESIEKQHKKRKVIKSKPEVVEEKPSVYKIEKVKKRLKVPAFTIPDLLSNRAKEKPKVKPIQNKKTPVLKGHTTVAVMGTANNVGTTHTALIICAAYAKTSKVAFVDFSESNKFSLFMQQHGVSEGKQQFNLKGITFYRDRQIYQNVDKYDLIVFDLGDYRRSSNQMNFRLAKKKIIVQDGSLYNKKQLLDFSKAYKDSYKDFTYVLKTASSAEVKAYKNYVDTKRIYTIGHEKNYFNPSAEVRAQVNRIIRS